MLRPTVRLWLGALVVTVAATLLVVHYAPVPPALSGQPTPTPAPTSPPPPPVIATTPFGVLHDPTFAPLPGATARSGIYEGGVYQIEVPANWNGGLVLYAHGFFGERPDIFVGPSPLRAHLIDRGYAWAAPSYHSNDYRPDWAMADLLALRDLFIQEFGQPRWTILHGLSWGAYVLVASLEQHPGVYQGGLSECGVLGIGRTNYQAAYLAAAEYISRVPLLDRFHVWLFMQTVENTWLPAMGRPGAYTERGRQFDSVVKYLLGGDLPFRTQGLAPHYADNLLQGALVFWGQTAVARAASTLQIQYQIDTGLGLNEEELNAKVRRKDPAPGAQSGENAIFAEFTGRITVPLLSFHTTGDARAPFGLEQDYRRKTIAAGTESLLVQRAIRRPMHCQFEPGERIQAFDDLVAWIEEGRKPEGDDVLSEDLSMIGLRWTSPLLPEDPARR